MSTDEIRQLEKYSACDISDALLKLNVPKAGFIPDLIPQVGAGQKIVGVISTANFVDKGPNSPPSQIPSDKHWVDLITPGTILIQHQSPSHRSAILGGIMAARLQVLGVKGVITHGRVRDITELEDMGLPIWSRGLSTVGQGFASKCESVGQPRDIEGVMVSPGDLVVADRNGVVVVPRERVEEVLGLLPKLVETDENVMAAVKGGMSVKEAFAKFR